MMEKSIKNPYAFLPLSEDALHISSPTHELVVPEDEEVTKDESFHLLPGERRRLHLAARVARGGRGRLLRTIHVPYGSRLLLTQQVRIDTDAAWLSVIAIVGEGEVIIERTTEIEGASSSACLIIVGVGVKTAELKLDDDVFCRAPRATVTLRTHTVLQDEARSVARARISVSEYAPQSTVDQSLSHLLLGYGAKGRAIPELDIATQEVACAHRSSLGRPRDEERFYLHARGLTDQQVDRLFAHGFLRSALIALPPDRTQKFLDVLESAV